jgi:hypothetical protein
VNNVILFFGLGLTAAAVVLAWRQARTPLNWVPFLFGFLFVLLGSPLVNVKTVELLNSKPQRYALSPVHLPADQEALITTAILATTTGARAAATQSALPPTQPGNAAAQVIEHEFLPYVRQLGFVPTQFFGATSVEPGSIIFLKDGHSTLIGTQEESFPAITAQTAAVPFPQMFVANELDKGVSTDSATVTCGAGASTREISLQALERTEKSDIMAPLAKSPVGYYVVQTVLQCHSFALESHSPSHRGQRAGLASRTYASVSPIVIGYKLLKVSDTSTAPPNGRGP